MPNSRVLLLFTIAFLCGVAVRSWTVFPAPVLIVILLVTGVVVALQISTHSHVLVVVVCVAGVVCGAARVASTETLSYTGTLQQWNGRSANIEGVISTEVDRRITKQVLTIRATSVDGKPVHGTMLASAGLYPEYAYGDRVRVQCSLEAPGIVEGFAYDEYLAVRKIYSLCRQPKLFVAAHKQGSSMLAGLFSVHAWLLARITQLYPEPHGSLLAGLIVGARSTLPDDLVLQFQRTGVSHIVALSGFNVTIILTALNSLFLSLGVARRNAFWFVVAAITAFVFMTGLPASIVRAAVMGMLALTARQIGRSAGVYRSLVLAAGAMIAINPRLLVHDVSFQLSFLSTLGLVLFSDWWSRRLAWLSERFGVRDAATATLAATTATLPLILFQFGRVSLISPVINLLILPLLPLTMLIGFFSLFIPFISPLLVMATSLLLAWILFVVAQGSAVTFSSVAISEHWRVGAVIAYGVMLVAMVVYQQRIYKKV